MTKDFVKLVSTFKNSIKTWDYFVNWNKVFDNVSEFEIALNKLNYLLGKNDIEEEFRNLYKTNPDIVKALPVLLAVRESKIEIYDADSKASRFFDFNTINSHTPDEYTLFLLETGLVKLFKEGVVKNLVDYVYGVEVGLDSNGRKNRGGTLMESIVEDYISRFCAINNYQYLSQANAAKIFNKWGVSVNVDKSSRSFDFAVYNPLTANIKLFETNFYNGGGSKLKSVCGEFKFLHSILKPQNIDFVWITDGLGWMTTLRPLEEVYNHNDYVFNLSMLEANILHDMKW